MLPEHERARLSKRLADIAEKAENGHLPFFKLMDALKLIAEGKLLDSNSWVNGKSFPLMINYNYSIRELLMSGSYSLVASTIDFPSFQPTAIGSQVVQVRLFHFSREIESQEILDAFQSASYRPITLFELLAFGMQYPKEQLISRIATFHSPENSPPEAFLLYGRFHQRSLGHYRAIGGMKWPKDSRFAVVKDEFKTF